MAAMEVERLLLEAVESKTVQPAEALQAVSAAASKQTTKWHFQRQISSLSPAAAAALRSLVYQALHGLAPERLRDLTLEALATLLCSESSCVDTVWTVEEKPSSGDATTSSKQGSFAVFLCSIIRGEIHLLREELECHHQGGEAPEGVLKYKDERHARALRMVGVTCRLVMSILDLLVAACPSLQEEGEGPAVWSGLPGESLLRVRQQLHSVLQDMLAHLDFASDALASRRGSSPGTHSLLLVARSFAGALGRWALEDGGLWGPLLRGLPALLGCSPLCGGDCAPVEALESTGEDVLLIVLPALLVIAEAAREDGDTEATALLCRESTLVGTLCSLVVTASAATTPSQVKKDIAGYSSSTAACATIIDRLRSCCQASELLSLLFQWQPEAAQQLGVQLRAAVAKCVLALEAEPLLLLDDAADDDNSIQAAYLDLFAALRQMHDTLLT